MKNKEIQATDWDKYYSKPFKATSFTRKITGNVLINLIKKNIPEFSGLKIVEFGGANSCFFELIQNEIKPLEYHIIDINDLGLRKLEKRAANYRNTFLYNDNVLNLENTKNINADLVFSIGLIEHFTQENTQRAIKSHFDILKPGGLAVMSFPTPTFLYNATRRLSEICKMWIFHDERPIKHDEVISNSVNYAELLDSKTIWLIFLTQGIIAARKKY